MILSLGAHLGSAKLKKTAMSSFYFSRMTTHIHVSSCEHCQRNKNYTVNTRGIPTSMTTPLCRFDVVTLDILSFSKQCKNGFDSVVVCTDRLSKRAYISPCHKTVTVPDLARIFFDTVFRDQGCQIMDLNSILIFGQNFLRFSELRLN
jgi:hypothetical protein